MRYSRTRLSAMDVVDQLTILGRSALAAALGIVIGLERETRGKAAGERTFALLSLGSAAFVSIGGFLFPTSADRIVQGIAAGVGFLGGGVIFRREAGVQGLTTAASAWAAAAIGDRTPPVLMVGEPGDLVARDALAPRDETWTHAALDDVGRNEGELLSG